MCTMISHFEGDPSSSLCLLSYVIILVCLLSSAAVWMCLHSCIMIWQSKCIHLELDILYSNDALKLEERCSHAVEGVTADKSKAKAYRDANLISTYCITDAQMHASIRYSNIWHTFTKDRVQYMTHHMSGCNSSNV